MVAIELLPFRVRIREQRRGHGALARRGRARLRDGRRRHLALLAAADRSRGARRVDGRIGQVHIADCDGVTTATSPRESVPRRSSTTWTRSGRRGSTAPLRSSSSFRRIHARMVEWVTKAHRGSLELLVQAGVARPRPMTVAASWVDRPSTRRSSTRSSRTSESMPCSRPRVTTSATCSAAIEFFFFAHFTAIGVERVSAVRRLRTGTPRRRLLRRQPDGAAAARARAALDPVASTPGRGPRSARRAPQPRRFDVSGSGGARSPWSGRSCPTTRARLSS